MGLNSKTLVDMSKNWETREQIRSKDSRGPQIAYTQNDAFQAGMETQNCIETIDHRSDEDECWIESAFNQLYSDVKRM